MDTIYFKIKCNLRLLFFIIYCQLCVCVCVCVLN